MSKKESIKQSALASYAVMKALTDDNKYQNSYGILADFIRYIIVDRKWYEFTITDLMNVLQLEFGFDNIPIPAIRTSLRQIKECKKNGDYYVVPKGTSFKTEAFQRVKQVSTDQSRAVVEKLRAYAITQYPQGRWMDSLEDAFIKYLLDDAATIEQRYTDIISKFIVKNKDDDEINSLISQIREGSILYCGLAYNISELGSITSELTIFLDTEVLFNIAGYNGALYQKLAEDFLNQVKAANTKQSIIKLRYFNEVKLEIEVFFNTAERIVSGHGYFINNTTAMKSIVNGCETVGDIRIKEADFFYNLQTRYGILLDEKQSYYTETDYPYNIESIPDGYPKDDRSFEAVRFISHINKLRKGKHSKDYTSCKYLLVTETRRIQEISNSLRTNKYECGYVLPTSTITNILWYKLGSCFSKKDYPINTDASIKARSIISAEISNSILKLYEDTKKQYAEGRIDKDQVAARVLLMRDKNRTPDEVTADYVDEEMDFSPDYIARYEEGIKQNKVQLQKKQEIIERLEAESFEKEEQNTQLSDKLVKAVEERDSLNTMLGEKAETIKRQAEELDQFHANQKKREGRIKKIKLLAKLILLLLGVAIVFIIAVFLITKLFESIAPQISSNIRVFVDIAGLVGYAITAIKGVGAKVYGKKSDTGEKTDK